MKNIIIVIIFSLLQFAGNICYSQKEYNIWYFGRNAGVDFSSGSPVAITDGQLNIWEGVASICDSTGKLLFYSDGISIWNRNHQVMNTGGSLKGSYSSTESAFIVRKPGSSIIYYVFTLADEAKYDGFNYTIVDMSLKAGLGDIVELNHFITRPMTEKIAAVTHCNGHDMWIITHQCNNNSFATYLLTDNGLNTVENSVPGYPIISPTGTTHSGSTGNCDGYLKPSPDGTRLACAKHIDMEFDIFDFDRSTGLISNPLSLVSSNYNLAYGVEWSPDGKILYGEAGGYSQTNVYQFNLALGTASNIINNAYVVQSTSGQYTMSALQIGPDNKIYVAMNMTPYLSVINNPNNLGASCNFKYNGVDLAGRDAAMGLPTKVCILPAASTTGAISLSIPDEHMKIGINDIDIPVTIKVDKNLLPLDLNNVIVNISLDDKVYKVNSVNTGNFIQNSVGTKSLITLFFNKLTITLENQEIAKISGTMLTNDKLLHKINIDNISYDEHMCIKPEFNNGSLSRLCGEESFTYNDFTSYSDFNFIGNAGLNTNFIRLTNSKINQVGAAWLKDLKPVASGFITNFKFRFLDGNNNICTDNSLPGADGIAFVIQNYNPIANGFFGGGIGYESISNCLAIEYDTFTNDSTQLENYYDPNGNHVAVQAMKNAAITSKHIAPYLKAINDKIVPIKTDGTIYYSRIEYDPLSSILRVYLDTIQNYTAPVIEIKNFVLSDMLELNYDQNAWLGFTSATGCSYEIHDILYWDFCAYYPDKINDVNDKSSHNDTENKITISPNPVTEILSIKTENIYNKLEIFTLLGECVLVEQTSLFVPNSIRKIDVSRLSPGIYFIKIGENVNKFVKI